MSDKAPTEKHGILVVGGCGHIGRLIALEVGALRHLSPFWCMEPHEHRDCLWGNSLVGSALDLGQTMLATQGKQTVVYLAKGRGSPFTLEPAPLLEVASVGFYNVCVAASELGVERVILIGSPSIYADWKAGLIEGENALPTALDPYGVSKAVSECIGKIFAENTRLSVIALRTTYVLDTVEATRVHNPQQSDWILQPYALSANALARALCAAIDLKDHRGFDVVHVAGDHRPSAPINLEKAKRLLGWEP